MGKKLGIIGEPLFRGLFAGTILSMDLRRRSIPYKSVQDKGIQADFRITYVDRYEKKHFLPPASIDYNGIFELFYLKNIRYVISLTVGTRLKDSIRLGDIVVPSDIIDFLQFLPLKLEHSVGHTIDLRELFSIRLRKNIIEAAKARKVRVVDRAVAIVTSGLRHETPAEARVYRMLGGEVITSHISVEALLARVYGFEYLPLVVIAYDAADKGFKQSFEEALDIVKSTYNSLRLLISGLELD